MPRNRVIYQSEALYVSKNINSTGSGDHTQLKRVQSANYNFSIERQDVNQFGQLARIDALVLQSPTVALDFTYYPTDGYNEKALGFYVRTGAAQSDVNFASGHMSAAIGQNFYIVTTDEGSDLNTQSGSFPLSGKSTIAIGNGFLSNYTFNASVGNLPTASVSIEGLNIKSSTILGSGHGITGGNFMLSPAINAVSGSELGLTGRLANPNSGVSVNGANEVTALRPGDITLGFSAYNATGATPISKVEGDNSFNVQSVSLALPLSRTPIERLGSKFAFTRVVDFPIVATMNVSAILSDTEARSLATMLDDNSKRDITLNIKKPGVTGVNAMVFSFKGSQLQSESFSSSIGANKTVDLVFQTQVGGPSDLTNGIYLSGSYVETSVAGDWGQ